MWHTVYQLLFSFACFVLIFFWLIPIVFHHLLWKTCFNQIASYFKVKFYFSHLSNSNIFVYRIFSIAAHFSSNQKHKNPHTLVLKPHIWTQKHISTLSPWWLCHFQYDYVGIFYAIFDCTFGWYIFVNNRCQPCAIVHSFPEWRHNLTQKSRKWLLGDHQQTNPKSSWKSVWNIKTN